ncbi:hypothetical protein [Sinosporangium siamense]|uniref:Peptidase C14 caspase domain-containing protein n=1 Tax=Sinosporangium siamense TaxID=1367973 RepID=A0A919RR69_9ACTN|nr:hypothetical protein [Sinosporangium siamense]GII97229.1 hypothetical protein Ssi02_74600 [Sinosporangium siamense]
MSSLALPRAILIAVPRFAGDTWDDLPFAVERAQTLATAMRSLGYECAMHTGPMTSAAIGEIVRGELTRAGPDQVLVFHLLTHGDEAARGIVYALGSDGERVDDIEHWLKLAQLGSGRPRTLFLLDLCYSGALARLPWHYGTAGAGNRAWVIAACQPDRPAFDGRFTEALAAVLGSIAAGEFDADPAGDHVPFADVARAVRRHVIRAAHAGGAWKQQVASTAFDSSEDVFVPPFFPNGAARRNGGPAAGARPRSPGRISREGGPVDRHFLDLLSGIGVGEAGGRAGRFTGRRDELVRLTPWLSGRGPGDLGMVTGGPGSGKSALVSVLACAAHPSLYEAALPLLDGVSPLPSPTGGGVAAVYARHRGPAGVVAAVNEQLGAQLSLPPSTTPGELIGRILGLAAPPLIVVDALDEADDGVAVMNELILPLSSTPRPDGRHAARVLVGCRDYREYQPIAGRARALGTLTDLDTVDREVLRKDLSRYVFGLLEDVAEYRPHGDVRGAFAAEIAQALTGLRARRECGEFLVAGLYTGFLIDSTSGSPLRDTAEARRFAVDVPRTLPEVLAVYLRAWHAAHPLLRACLSVLAEAKGEGMPIGVLSRIVAARAGLDREPGFDELLKTLRAGSVFLRQSAEAGGGAALYRLFHQELVDHLATGTSGADADLPALLSALGPPGARDWEAAEPYLIRHALQHAQAAGRAADLLDDPEFLLRADHRWLPAVAALGGETLARVVAEAGRPRRTSLEERRSKLALGAARAGLAELARRAAHPPGAPPLAWRPVWSVGVAGPPGDTHGPDGTARHSPPPGDFELPRSRKKQRVALLRAVSGAAGLVVAADGEGWLSVWDLRERRLWPPFPTHRGRILALDCALRDGDPVAITTGDDGQVKAWELAGGRAVRTWSAKGFFPALARTSLGGREVALLASGDGWLQVRDAATGEVLKERAGSRLGYITSVACARAGGRDLAVTTARDGRVCVTDLGTGEQVGAHRTAHRGSAHAAICLTASGRSLAVTAGGGGTLRVWELGSGLTLAAGIGAGPDSAESLAATLIDGRPVAVTVGRDGKVVTWDLGAGGPIARESHPPVHPGHGVHAVEVTRVDGHLVAVTGGNSGVLHVWDLSSCRPAAPALSPASAGERAGVRIDRVEVLGDDLLALEHAAGELVVRARDGVPPEGSPARPPAGSAVSGAGARVTPDDPYRIWWGPGGVPLGSQDTPVTALATGEVAGTPVVFSGDGEGTVRVWDCAGRGLADVFRVPAGVAGLTALPGGLLVVNASGELIAFRRTAEGA